MRCILCILEVPPFAAATQVATTKSFCHKIISNLQLSMCIKNKNRIQKGSIEVAQKYCTQQIVIKRNSGVYFCSNMTNLAPGLSYNLVLKKFSVNIIVVA